MFGAMGVWVPSLRKVGRAMLRGGTLEELISLLVREGGSDLHLKVGSPPVTRVQGLLAPVEGYGVLDFPDTEAFLAEIIPEPLVEEFERDGEADFSYETGPGRFRVNAFRQRGAVSIVMRYIPFDIPKFEELGLPDICRAPAPIAQTKIHRRFADALFFHRVGWQFWNLLNSGRSIRLNRPERRIRRRRRFRRATPKYFGRYLRAPLRL